VVWVIYGKVYEIPKVFIINGIYLNTGVSPSSRRIHFTGFHPPFVGLFPLQTDSIWAKLPIRCNFASSTSNKRKKMKTINILLAALFTLQVSVLFAGNESVTMNSTPVETTLDLTALIPVTPDEAIFEEVTSVAIDFTLVAPVVPVVADFEDVVPVIDLGSLAPAVPVEADFSDTVDQAIDISTLAPVAPMVADFE
jgi:hypothetical protein